jgi:hypothetical protein
MPEPTKQDQRSSRTRGKTFRFWTEVDGHRWSRPFYKADPNPPNPPSPPPADPPPADLGSNPEVQRIIAKELAKQGRELGGKLTAAEEKAKAAEGRIADMEGQLAALQGKAGADAEIVRTQLQGQIKKLTEELGEARKTLSAVQTRADAEAVGAVAERLASTATTGKDRLKALLSMQLVRQQDGSIVWKDPETDELKPPSEGLAAWKKSDPYFWMPPPSGSGTTAGSPPVAGKKNLVGMNKAELAAQFDREAD